MGQVAFSKPRVVVPGTEPPRKPKPVRPNTTQRMLQQLVDDFNRLFPVGTEVMLRKDTETIRTTVTHPAEILGGHSAVGWFDGVRGCYAIDGRVCPVEESFTGMERSE